MSVTVSVTVHKRSSGSSNGCRMLRPIKVSAHGPKQPFSQLVNCKVFWFAGAPLAPVAYVVDSTMYATSASGLRGPKRLSYSNWEMGSVGHI